MTSNCPELLNIRKTKLTWKIYNYNLILVAYERHVPVFFSQYQESSDRFVHSVKRFGRSFKFRFIVSILNRNQDRMDIV